MGETREAVAHSHHVNLNLLIAGRCNLACDYCYQDSRRCSERMPWSVIEAAAGAVASIRPSKAVVCFSGGEPLLEGELLRSAVLHARATLTRGITTSLEVVTNGTLLTGDLLAFLVEHDVALRLSMDGRRPAQEQRGVGTFELLDRILDDCSTRHPEFFGRRLRVAVAVTETALDHLGDSIRYLIGKGVAEIRMSPRIGPVGGWDESSASTLDRQLAEVVDISVKHWNRTGRVPVAFLRDDLRHGEEPQSSDFICRAPTGTTFTVDPDGRAWLCPALVGSMQKLPARAREIVRLLELGDVRDAEFLERLRSMPDVARGLREFTATVPGRSLRGTCRHCDSFSSCFICPAAMLYSGDVAPSARVPDLHCAFYRGTDLARRAFLRAIGGHGVRDSLVSTVRWLQRRIETRDWD